MKTIIKSKITYLILIIIILLSAMGNVCLYNRLQEKVKVLRLGFLTGVLDLGNMKTCMQEAGISQHMRGMMIAFYM